jgi:hypothetical protein
MKLRRREKPKKDQALHALASVTKVWSEWQLAKRAGKGVGKGVEKAKELRRPSKLKRMLSNRWVKIGGAAAVAGGAATAVARKLKGDEPESYTGPPPSAAVEAAKAAGETITPLNLAPDPATQPSTGESASGPSALRHVHEAEAEEAGAQAPEPESAGDAPKAGDQVATPDAEPEPEPEPELPEPEEQPVVPVDEDSAAPTVARETPYGEDEEDADDDAAPTVLRETPTADAPSDDEPAADGAKDDDA